MKHLHLLQQKKTALIYEKMLENSWVMQDQHSMWSCKMEDYEG